MWAVVFFRMLFVVTVLTVVPGPAQGQGAEKRRTGNVCHTDGECPDNAFCKSGSYCECKNSYVYAATSDNRSCLKVGSYGDPCSQDIQCHTTMGVHAECLLGTCSCQTKTQFVGDRCYKLAVVGERCVTDFNCFLAEAPNEAQAFCVRGYCMCQLHYSPRDNGSRCVRDAILGEECIDQLQCAGHGLECRGTCRCKEGFTAHNESKVCLETVNKLGEACEYDVQCDGLSGAGSGRTSAAMCLSGVCACGFDARATGDPSRCWHIRRPGQQCRRDEECFSEDDQPGFCRAGRCTCTDCVPDARDFSDSSSSLAPIPVVAAILATAAILA